MSVSAPTTANPVANMLISQVVEGINAVDEANVTLLAETEAGTGVREIDKAIKELGDDGDKDLLKAREQVAKAQAAFKKAQENARNLYRTKVLGEEEQAEAPEIDTDALKNQRKMVVEAVTFLKSFAHQNSLPEVEKWADTLEIPQVGRQGTSTVGQKKPRAYVTVGETTHESFGEAAKALSGILSTNDSKVTVTPGDLVSAWDEAGEKDSFDFQGQTVRVARKETKKAAA